MARGPGLSDLMLNTLLDRWIANGIGNNVDVEVANLGELLVTVRPAFDSKVGAQTPHGNLQCASQSTGQQASEEEVDRKAVHLIV